MSHRQSVLVPNGQGGVGYAVRAPSRAPPKLVGFAGPAGSGKDTVAQAFKRRAEEAGYAVDVYHYATALKEGCRSMFGLTDRQLYGDLKEVKDAFHGVTPREILQGVGTDLFRKRLGGALPGLSYAAEDFWVHAVRKRYEESSADFFLTPDVRFPNEVANTTACGGRVYMLQRHGSGTAFAHESEELAFDPSQMVRLENNGTVAAAAEAIWSDLV